MDTHTKQKAIKQKRIRTTKDNKITHNFIVASPFPFSNIGVYKIKIKG